MKKSNNTSKISGNKQDVQGQLKEFYKIAKEKLLVAKSEVETCAKEYEAQKVINQKKNLEYLKLLSQNKELDLRIKGMNEKIIISKKNEVILQNQIKDIKEEIKVANDEIDQKKMATDSKVQRVSNNNSHINTVKENQLKSIEERKNKELEINSELKQKIKEIENRINDLTANISSNAVKENKKNELLLNDAAEMNKFLSEL